MMKVINMLLFSLVLSGCSSPPPPVPVEWNKPGQSVNTGLPQWWLMINGYCPFMHGIIMRHAGRPLYFTRSPTQRVLLLQRHQAQIFLRQKTGCVSMAQKALLHISRSLTA